MDIRPDTVFGSILKPVLRIVEDCGKATGNDSENYKLSFVPFTLNLMYGIIMGVPSIAQLVTHIRTSPALKALNTVIASKSMYSEAFLRYPADLYRNIFVMLLKNLQFQNIPDLEAVGKIFLVDGSHFPAIQSMHWATYKAGINSIKMHLAFELNRMIPVCFASGEGNGSERGFLIDIIENGITYVCDRGYVAFSVFHKIHDADAFFIIRGTSNLLYDINEYLTVSIPYVFIGFFSEITDIRVTFTNDENNVLYRIVSFKVAMETYILITNRFDLTTYQVIMLYAYRWQVELVFRFLKRTLRGVHLYSQDPKGVEVQFYLFMICYLLLLFFKQECVMNSDGSDGSDGSAGKEEIATPETGRYPTSDQPEPVGKNGRRYVRGLVSLLGEKLQRLWKIDIHWLIAARNLLMEPIDSSMVMLQ